MSFLDTYLLISWLLCIAASVLVRLDRRPSGCVDVVAVLIFALGWPVVLPVVALVMRSNEKPSSDG